LSGSSSRAGLEERLRKFLAVEHLDPALVALIYLHVRGGSSDAPRRTPSTARAGDLSHRRRQSSDEPPVDLLALHTPSFSERSIPKS
jgi:hypothetical protein